MALGGPPGPVIHFVLQISFTVFAEVCPAIIVRIARASPATTLALDGEMSLGPPQAQVSVSGTPSLQHHYQQAETHTTVV